MAVMTVDGGSGQGRNALTPATEQSVYAKPARQKLVEKRRSIDEIYLAPAPESSPPPTQTLVFASMPASK